MFFAPAALGWSERAVHPLGKVFSNGGTMPKQQQKWTASTFTTMVYEQLTKKGIKVKKSDLNAAIQQTFDAAITAGARGQRVRFPGIGAMAWREVKARKAGKGRNPFTGEEIMLKARPASRKPRWSFPKAVKDAYARSFRKAA
jgi:nucleoid DNA-binding protein